MTEPGLSAASTRLLAALRRGREEICRINQAETGYTASEVAELFAAMERFLCQFPVLADAHEELLTAENRFYLRLNSGVELRYGPHGRCLLVIPSNAAIPLACILPFSFAAAGNHVQVVANRQVLETSRILVTEVQRHFPERVNFIPNSVRDTIARNLEGRSIELLYFTGGSAMYSDLSGRCAAAGVKLIFEGEGRTIAVVFDIVGEEQGLATAEEILSAKLIFGGRMCSAPNLVVVHRPDLERFKSLLAQAAARKGLSAPLFLGADEGATEHANRPVFVIVDSISASFAREWFSPAAYLCAYDDQPTLATELARAPYRLQLSLFGAPRQNSEELIESTRFPRYCRDMNPVRQDPVMPWGNEGLSGHSDLLDFYRKALRRVIIEEWDASKLQ